MIAKFSPPTSNPLTSRPPSPGRPPKFGASAFHVVLILLATAIIAGCTTPNVKPFADASSTLATSVKMGGDLTFTPLASKAIWVGDAATGSYVQPDQPEHPIKQLQAQWELRRKAMDAVLVYSASLEAISQASADRKANAEALAGSVQNLAGAVPGYGAAFKEGYTLVVKKGIETIIEVKAWHDMHQAVQSADAVVQKLAQPLKESLEALPPLFEAPFNDQLTSLGAKIRSVARLQQALAKQRLTQRGQVQDAPGDSTKGAELARLDTLYAVASEDVRKIEVEREAILLSISQGQRFFKDAANAVDAWAQAHAELAKAFQEKRIPNFTLLIARAQELKEIVDQIKKK